MCEQFFLGRKNGHNFSSLQFDFEVPPIDTWGFIFHFLNLGGPCNLLWQRHAEKVAGLVLSPDLPTLS